MTAVSVPAPVARLLNAVNSEDRAAFLASFSEDGVVDDCGRLVHGRRAIESWSDTELIGDGCRLTVHGVRTRGDDVEIYADVVSMGFNGPTTMVFTVRDGEVAAIRLTD
jgi:ketosteroid isomerase-like protein